jgi:hypothetical protein
VSSPLLGDSGDVAICTEMRRAQAFDTIDSLVRYTAQSTAMLEHVAQLIDAAFRAARDATVLDDIARILRCAEPGVPVLGDIGALVRETGRAVDPLPGGVPLRDRQ